MASSVDEFTTYLADNDVNTPAIASMERLPTPYVEF